MTETSLHMPQRTDPRTFAVKAMAMMGQLVVPLVIAGATIFDKAGDRGKLVYALPFVLMVIAINFALAYMRWLRLTYEVRDSDIKVESGLLSRSARSVPYERIQDVSLEQKFLPRLFGLTEVKFETGAGGGEDLKLSFLSEEEGERLRQLVRARRDGAEVVLPEHGEIEEAPDSLLFAMGPQRVLVFGLFEFSLAVVAAVAGAAQQFDYLLPFEWWDVRKWYTALSGPGHWLFELGVLAQGIAILLALGSLLLVGTVTGLARTALREWGFRLERGEKGLRRRRGLMTRTDVVMPLHRVQALRLGTGILRRRFGWHSLKVVSLASDSGSTNHDAVPFGRLEEIAPVVAETGFTLPSAEVEWHPSAQAYRFDRAMLGAAALGLVAIGNLVFGHWPIALGAALIGFVWIPLHEYLRWRFDRYAIDAKQLYSRHGWLAPSLSIASRVKLQSVEIVRGPLARLRGYADLHFGLAGGRLRMRGVPLEQARRIRAGVLDSIAGTDFSELSVPA
ncbi:PH domain-containing protein [Erythrobacter mangrovi]|uniref:PH domain-containing protein n=1 Tax=Erythrobacter mangrovi TaxID=2739433 RepID=A0A7D4BNF2_9SPHN|nr:PH domain-containing protein [Erythrobacter mangrovi]QKG70984.1 PH domain-containing protein [Erythrobacter mangrovi]